MICLIAGVFEHTKHPPYNYGLASDTADLMSLSASGEQHSHHIRSREFQVNCAWTDKNRADFFVLALGVPLLWGPGLQPL